MNPKVSIIILNWNGWEDTIECLESLYQITYPNYDVIVVDNGSEDESIEKIKEYAEGKGKVESKFFEYNPENKPIKVVEYTREEAEAGGGKEDEIASSPPNRKLIFIKNEKNYGFAEGNNIAMRYALKALNPDYILLLNNDTVVDKEFLTELVKVAESDERIGIAGPKIYFYDEPRRLWATGDQKSIGKIDNSQYNDIKEVKRVLGCAFFVRVRVLEKVGLLDPDFFLYGEEDDYCMRVKTAGYKLYFSPSSLIWHKSPLQGLHLKPYQVYYNSRNNIILRRKNYPGINFYIFMFRYLLINRPLYVLRLLKSGRYDLIIPMLKGMKDGILWYLGIKQAGENKYIKLR
jgi:GT2 family glycosyltransferase